MYSNTEGTTSDSPAEPISEQVNGRVTASSQSHKVRLLRILLLTLVVLAGIGGVLVFSVLTSRPIWHTVLSNGKPGSLVIAIDCPDNWNSVPIPTTRMAAAMSQYAIQLKRQPPNGLMRWWIRDVLHQDDINQTEATILVMMVDNKSTNLFRAAYNKKIASTAQGTEVLANMEQSIIPSRPGYHITKQRVQHPLGPALRISRDTDTTLMPNAASIKVTRKQIADTWIIIPQTDLANAIVYLTITCSSPSAEAKTLKPLYAEVIQRVHLIRKP